MQGILKPKLTGTEGEPKWLILISTESTSQGEFNATRPKLVCCVVAIQNQILLKETGLTGSGEWDQQVNMGIDRKLQASSFRYHKCEVVPR